MKNLPAIGVLPTLFTLGNLVCGFFAIVVAARVDIPDPTATDPTDWTNCMISGCLILLAMVFDALDGQLARLTQRTGPFGAQLDSLCDMISFGVAPAFLLVKICPDFTYVHREQVWVIAAAFAACAALRLARFTVETDESDDHLTFRGLPSPGAACAIASFAIMLHTMHRQPELLPVAVRADKLIQGLLPFYGLLLGLLMVSNIPYPHVVSQWLAGRRSFSQVVGLVFAVVLVALYRTYALPLVTTLFVMGPPVYWLYHEGVGRRARRVARD